MAEPIQLSTQGSFMIGGAVRTDGIDTFRGDHAYVQFQIPLEPRPFPLILWHGGSLSGSSWESTPDGREGFQTLLVRRNFSTYIIDRPNKGRAGAFLAERSREAKAMGDRSSWNSWRLGIWESDGERSFFPNLQLPTDDEVIDQVFRRRTPETTGVATELTAFTSGSMDKTLVAIDALLSRIGPSVLVIHSDAGRYGWLSRIRNSNVAGIIAYEPGTFVFPEDAPPGDYGDEDVTDVDFHSMNDPVLVPRRDFERLAEIPIQLVYGDNITTTITRDPNRDLWWANSRRARQFQRSVNEIGGQVDLLTLSEIGHHGNTHFPFSDLNNVDIADLLVEHLERNKLA